MPRRSDKNKKPLSYLSDNFIFTHRHRQTTLHCKKAKQEKGKSPSFRRDLGRIPAQPNPLFAAAQDSVLLMSKIWAITANQPSPTSSADNPPEADKKLRQR